MFSRSTLARSAPRATAALRQQSLAVSRRRCLATAADAAKYEYETSEAAGIKFANQNIPGLTGSLTVVAKGGSRYQASEGFSEVLEKFAFRSTNKRSQLRITRETELLGGELTASHSRETFVLSTKFLNQDLPYFAELLAEVLQDTKYTEHELEELVLPQVKYSQSAHASNPVALALDAAHTTAFHWGLGNNPVPALSAPWKKNMSAESVSTFAKNLYIKPSLAIVGSGNNTADLGKWINQFFPNLSTSAQRGPFAPQPHIKAGYFGGDVRVPSTAGNAFTIAFPGSGVLGSDSYNPAFPVLAELLGGTSNLKWSNGTSLFSIVKADTPGNVNINTANYAYSDAGLFTITVTGPAPSIRLAGRPIVETIQAVVDKGATENDIKKAIANAKYRLVENFNAQTIGHDLLYKGDVTPLSTLFKGLENVTEEHIKAAAQRLMNERATVAAVGDLDQLPYGAEIGLDA
ncbi:ubiquinol-cytochrome c reductase core subunit 1 [Ascosphaera pollenicola]|nr:ubiquinol-cytochrome c reductase core subunit 1 [Ascosphaera pollenicola]